MTLNNLDRFILIMSLGEVKIIQIVKEYFSAIIIHRVSLKYIQNILCKDGWNNEYYSKHSQLSFFFNILSFLCVHHFEQFISFLDVVLIYGYDWFGNLDIF